MKKINWLIAFVAIVAAALLVMLYFALGFQHVDNYLDVYLGILWVAIIAVFAADVYAALEYGFEVADRPESYDPKYIVDTKRFQAHRDVDNKLVVDTWEGTLSKYQVNEDGKEQIQEVAQYNDEYELVDALRRNQVFA